MAHGRRAHLDSDGAAMTTIAEARKQARHARFVLDDSPGGVGDTLDLALDVIEAAKHRACLCVDSCERDGDTMEDCPIGALTIALAAFEAGL
jgi:hypothetical protein